MSEEEVIHPDIKIYQQAEELELKRRNYITLNIMWGTKPKCDF